MTRKFFYKRIFTVIGCASLFFYSIVNNVLSSETETAREERRPSVVSSSLHKGAAARKQDEVEHPSATASYSLSEEFADPTTDTAFKQLLSLGIGGTDYSITVSFLNCFVPAFATDPITYLEEYPVAIPVLRKKGEKQAFMDFHVTTRSKEHIVIEMQVKRHILFDERALFYAAATYSRQLTEKEFNTQEWYQSLRRTFAVQILGYDSNRVKGIQSQEGEDTLVERVKDHSLKEGEYVKHYMMTDQNSGQTIDHLQMIQIELPRVKKNLFPPRKDFTEKDWWLSLFKHAKEYTRDRIDHLEGEGIKMPDPMQRAFGRLEMARWEPSLVKDYVADELNLKEYGTVLAVERAEGKAEGEKDALLKTARAMIGDNFANDLIAKLTTLSIEEIQQLRTSK